MDFINLVKDNKNKPMPHSCKAFFHGGENVQIEGRNSSLEEVITRCRKQMAENLGRDY